MCVNTEREREREKLTTRGTIKQTKGKKVRQDQITLFLFGIVKLFPKVISFCNSNYVNSHCSAYLPKPGIIRLMFLYLRGV